MSPSNKLHHDRIDWTTIKEDDFNRVVEALLLRKFDQLPQEVFVLNGRGGDGGIDVAVREKDIITHIFQLKWFLDGFTGPKAKTRKAQIKSSFEAAWKNHRPPRWTLLMPPNPHKNELEYIEALPKGRPVKARVFGNAWFDQELANYPEIEKAALRNELVALLKQINQERAGLVGPEDLSARLTALNEIADSRSLYWATDFSVRDGVVTETYRQKHPNAQEFEPMRTTVTFALGPEHSDVAAQVRHTLDYGAFEPVTVPPKAASFLREAPAWANLPPLHPVAHVQLVSQTTSGEREEPIVLVLLDERGFSRGRFAGKIVGRTKGLRGASVKAIFANIVTAVIWLDNPGEEPGGGGLRMRFDAAGSPAADVAQAFNLREAITMGGSVELYMGKKTPGKGRLRTDGAGEAKIDPYTAELVDDLVTIQNKIPGANFLVPDALTNEERAMIRIGRLLLEGYRTVMPPGTALTAIVAGDPDAAILDLIKNGGQFVSRPKAFGLKIQGSEFDLGAATLFHRNVGVVDSQSALTTLTSASVGNLDLQMIPQDDELIQVWLGDWKDESSNIPLYRGWDLTGFGPVASHRPPAEAPAWDHHQEPEDRRRAHRLE